MAKRNEHTREELKEISILAGKKMIEEDGLSAFSTRKLAQEIGYTVGTLYNIFNSYDDIVLHINARTLDNMKDFFLKKIKQKKKKNQENAQENNRQSQKNIEILTDLYIEFATKNLNCWLALFNFTTGKETQLPEWYNEKMQMLFLFVEEPLKSLSFEDTEKTKEIAKILWASIHGICYLELTNKLDAVNANSVQIMTHSLIDYFFKGIYLDNLKLNSLT